MNVITNESGPFALVRCPLARALVIAAFLSALPLTSEAFDMPPGWGPPTNTPTASWSFQDQTNLTSDQGYSPVSFTNTSFSWLGNGASLVMNTNVPAWLNFNVIEPSTGATNLVLDGPGSVTIWYASSWASTNGGPGQWAELIDVGEWTPDASYGYWGLSVDPAGSNLWFVAQDGAGNDYGLSTPISWTTNYFHFVCLTYSSTNVSIYIDGALATNDPGGLSVWPGLDAISGGIYFGSDTNGFMQADGFLDTIEAFGYPLASNDVQRSFNWSYRCLYLIDPYNSAMNEAAASIVSAPSSQTTFMYSNNVITGTGFLTPVRTNTTSCLTSSNVWMTNVLAAIAGTNMNLTFTIAGGSNAVPYDVFANSVLALGTNYGTNVAWAWMGQGYQCVTYTLTNLPLGDCFLILGTPKSTTGDGLSDAYKLLVAKLNPNVYSTDGTGMADGWEILYYGHTGVVPNTDPDGDGLTTFQEWLMHSGGYNPLQLNSFTNSVVGDGYQDYSGDGLANLMEAAFGGNMLTNNPTWKVNAAGDGLPDLYKTMVGLNTNSASPAPGLPTYSKNPVP